MQSTVTEKALSYLSEILDTLRSTNQHEHVLHLIVDRLVRIYNCQVCAVVLIDKKSEYLNIENSHGLSWTFCKEFRRKLATGPIGELLWTGRPILVNDSTSPCGSEVRLEHPFGSCIIVQIAVDQRTLGYLYADTQLAGAFKNEDIPLLQTFANAAGIALHKSQLHYENMHLDKVDHETGLEKYESFVEKVRTSLDRAERFQENFAIALLDIDNFKLLSKTYGYETSRHFLKELGELIGTHLRGIDAAGRYGFDEVIIALARSSLEQAVAFAHELCRAVQDHAFTPHEISTTISIGVACYPDNGKSIDKLLTSAKNALFEAQRSGRNKVFHYASEWDVEQTIICEHN